MTGQLRSAQNWSKNDSDSDDGYNDENIVAIGDADQRCTELNKYYIVAFFTSFDCEKITTLQFGKREASARGIPKLSVVARSVYVISAKQNRSARASNGVGHVVRDLRSTIDPEYGDELQNAQCCMFVLLG